MSGTNIITHLASASVVAWSMTYFSQTSSAQEQAERTGTTTSSKPLSCCTQPSTKMTSPASSSELISLAESVDEFKERFNTASDSPRFVAIISSTCGPCISGAVTVNEAIIKGFVDADVDVSIVWIDVLPSDGPESADRASLIFDDDRVTQYHDPKQHLGNVFAEGLVQRPPAWDIYLFYPAGMQWKNAVPKPIDWMHQLGGGVAEMSRFKTETLLAADMHSAMSQLGFETGRSAPTSEQLAKARTAATARIGKAACGTTPNNGEQCSRCAATGSIGQCSVSGWRYVVASKVRDSDDAPTNRFEMGGAATGPVTVGEIDPRDARHVFKIEGMTCPDCIVQVAGKTLQARGITRVEVDYDHKRLIVYTRDEPGSKLEMLPTHLEVAGYRIEPVRDADEAVNE